MNKGTFTTFCVREISKESGTAIIYSAVPYVNL